jgi:hypothetical protein
MGQMRERRLISEYVAERFSKDRVILGCPLGSAPEKLIATLGPRRALRVARGLRPEVDALVVRGQQLIMVEAKIRAWVDGIAKLPLYKSLVPTTPELEQYKDYPVEMRLCFPWYSETIDQAAKNLGVVLDVYHKPWIDEYLEELGKYWSGEYITARAEKRRMREILGVE